MEEHQLLYNRTPISGSKSQSPQENNKWVSVAFDKTRIVPLQQDNIIYLKGRSTITIKHVLNTICKESFIWNSLITLAIWLNFILITYTYIFTRPKAMTFELFPMILILDILFILDVARSTSMFFGHVKLERRNADKRDSFMTYLDILLASPIDYSLYYFYRHLQSAWFIWFRLISTLRAYRIYTYFNKYNAIIGMHHTFMGITKFLSTLTLIVHTLTCILHGNIGPPFSEGSEQNRNSKEIYFEGMFRAFSTVSHFGYGFVRFETSMERFISCIGMLCGYFLINGMFVPIVWNFCYSNLINRIILCNQKRYVVNYLQSINCVHILSKILRYYNMFWIKKRGINKPEIFNSLNVTFQEDVHFDKNYKFLKYSITFRDFPESYLRRISFLMKHEFYDTGDYIFKQNCVKDKMIWVVKGIIDIVSFEDSNSPVISFGHGTCISECSLVFRLLSKTAVKAATYLELQVIYRKDFYKTLTHYPEQFRSISHQISKRICTAQEKSLTDPVTPFNTTESTYIEKLKDKSQTKTRINLSLAYVHYKFVEKSNSKSKYLATINILWRFIVCILAMYVAIAYPYYICFKKLYPDFLGHIADTVFIVDVFVSISKRSFRIRKTRITWKTSAALKCLDSPYFYLNLLSAFPFEIFALAIPIDPKSRSNFSYIRICLTLKFNRLFKVYKIHLLLRYFEAKFKIKVCFVKIVRILLIYLLALYWTATILYFVTCYNHSCDLNGWFANKTRQENNEKLLEPLTRYPLALSMYFSSCVLLGIEIGDVFPTNKIETVVVGIMIFFGIVLRGVVLGTFIAILSLSQTSKCAYQSRLYKVISFVKKRSFPAKLKYRLINFYTLQSNCNKNINIEDLEPINRLPTVLQTEIRIVECLDTLESAKLFSDFDDEFTNWVAHNTKLLILPPKEVVLYQGSTTRTLYILQKGYCYEKYAGNSIYKNHGPCTVFGYNSFLFTIPEQSQVTTSTHCQFVLIDYEVLKMAKIEFPHIMEQIQMAIRNSLAGEDVNYDIKMLEHTLYKDYNNHRSKLDERIKKNIHKLNEEDSFNNMRQFCKHREDYFRPFLKLGNYQWFKYLLMHFTINPHGLFFKLWTFLRLVIAFAYGILGPVQYIVAPYHSMLHIFLAILDCLTYIDLYLRFHVAFYNLYGYLVTHPYSTACNYFKGPFALDLVLCLPTEWILYAIWGTSHHEGHRDSEYTGTMEVHGLHCGLRLIRMLQLYRIVLFVKNCERELRLKRYVLAIFTYLCACLVILNAWACMLVALNCTYTNEKNGFQDGELNVGFICQAGSWHKSSTYAKFNSFVDVYIAAFYFVTSVSMSIGFGDISPKMFRTLDMTTAMIITNWIAITYLVAKIIASAEYNSVKQEDHKKLLAYQNKIKELMMYLKNSNVSVDNQRHLKNYLHYVWNRSNGTQNLSSLFGVHDSLLQDCFSYLYEDILRKVPIFRRMGRAFYRTFGQEVKEMYFLKNQYIIRSRDIVDQIYIVKNGKVDFFVSDGVFQFTMGTGGIFGNLTQTKMIIFNGLVIANTNVDLLVVTSEAFMAIINAYPSIKERLECVIVDDREYYAPPDTELNDSEHLKRINKNGFNVPIFAYHNKFQNILLMKAYIKNWLDFIFLFSAYLNCLLVLYQFSFQDFSLKYILASVLIDIVFVLKMCLAFNRPVINRFGDTVKKLQSSYFNRKINRSLDIFINLSSITSYFIFYLPSRNVATAGFTIWRLICLLRIYYLFVFFRKKNKDILANRIVIIICAIFIWLSLLLHTSACMWYIIICPMSNCPKDLWESIVNTSEPFDMYIASLYFIICIFTSTGRGDILPRNTSEMIFVVMFILISTISNAMVLAELSKGVYMDFRVRYEREVKDIKCYLNRKGIKQYQVNKVVQYLKNIWTYSYGNKIPGIIAELPISIKTDLLWIVYGRTFKESYIFSNTEEPFLRHLMVILDFQIYFQNDYITRDGTIDERVFFIYKGEVSIVTHYSNQTDVVHDTLHSGDVFGLGQGLFPGVAHHFSFRANATTEILSLKLENWKYLLDLFPASREIIYDRIENIYI